MIEYLNHYPLFHLSEPFCHLERSKDAVLRKKDVTTGNKVMIPDYEL